MKKENRNNKGFSLVELIVVIAIMAVLVGILAPQFLKYVEKSRQATDIQTIDNIATSLKTYYADKEGTGTKTIEVTTTSVTSDTAITDAGLSTAKLKGKKWDGNKITITYDIATGVITYSGQSTYYKTSGDQFIPE